MPIPFICPHCGAETEVADRYAGQSGPCASCGNTIHVPAAPMMGVGGQPVAYQPAKKSSVGLIIGIVVATGFVILVCGGILVALLLPAVQAAREAARRNQCNNNMKQISLALLNYEATYKSFPPAYVADENGKPMHSWRVLILPFIEEQSLYDQYDFDKPWNSPENMRLAPLMPSVYACPSDYNEPNETSYLAITGPGTAFPGDQSTKIDDFRDGLSNTIIVAEATGSGVNWLEPRDLDVTTMTFSPNSGPNDPSSNHRGAVNVALADGSVQTMIDGVDPTVLKGMATISGGEPVQLNQW